MSDDEKKQPLFPQWNIGAALFAPLLAQLYGETMRTVAALQPVGGRMVRDIGVRPGTIARRKWKRRRAAGWDR